MSGVSPAYGNARWGGFLLALCSGSLLILALPVVWLQWQLGCRFKGTQVGSLCPGSGQVYTTFHSGSSRWYDDPCLWFNGGGFYILVWRDWFIRQKQPRVFNQVSLASSKFAMSERKPMPC